MFVSLTMHRFVLYLCLVVVGSIAAQAQLKNFTQPRYKPKKAGDFDTVARMKSVQFAEESAGLLEREIDASAYIVGPGDVLTFSVWSTDAIHTDVAVTPEGRVILPGAGVVDVRGMTLAKARETLVAEAMKTYRSKSIDVSLKRLREFKVTIMGAVRSPAIIAATGADRVFDVIQRAGGVLDTGSVRGIYLLRDGVEEPIIVDLQRYLSFGDRSSNPLVEGGDRLVVPLRNDKTTIGIRGEVPQAAEFDYLPSDSLSTLVRFGGGFLPSANLDSVQVVRVSEQGGRLEEVITVDLSSWRTKLFSGQSLDGDMPLRTGDRVYVREIPRWRERHEVKIRGEVKYPGEYAIEPNATRLTEVIARAGGFSEKASLEDAVIIRTKEMNLEDKEYKRLEKLPPSEMSVTELQYFRTKAREVRGVISVNFTDLFNKGSMQNNPVLQDGDSIYVPERNNYVNVSGSVRNPGRIVFKPGLTYEQYIDLAGGYGFRADRDATFVVKVKGDQFPADSENYTLEPGDNILVLDEPETLAIDIFTKALTIATQLVTIMGVVLTIVRLQ